jgi:hypothetical protein
LNLPCILPPFSLFLHFSCYLLSIITSFILCKVPGQAHRESSLRAFSSFLNPSTISSDSRDCMSAKRFQI